MSRRPGSADIPDADSVGHNHNDVGFFGWCLSRRRAGERERERYYCRREKPALCHRFILLMQEKNVTCSWSAHFSGDAPEADMAHRGVNGLCVARSRSVLASGPCRVRFGKTHFGKTRFGKGRFGKSHFGRSHGDRTRSI